MRQNKFKPRKKRKFRLLLDSAFAKPEAFLNLKKKAKLIHPVHDLGLSPQTEDKDLYERAINGGMFILTINFKDFKKLVKKGKPGVIGIDSQLSNTEIDKKVSKFLSDKDPDDYLGKATKI